MNQSRYFNRGDFIEKDLLSHTEMLTVKADTEQERIKVTELRDRDKRPYGGGPSHGRRTHHLDPYHPELGIRRPRTGCSWQLSSLEEGFSDLPGLLLDSQELEGEH